VGGVSPAARSSSLFGGAERVKHSPTDGVILGLLASALLALHVATNGQYGFHRDELATLDDARFLSWGYVAYPPLLPFVARLAVDLFGLSLVGVRLPAATAAACALFLAGMMARELGGGRWSQVLAAVTAGIAPIALLMGAMLQYVAFDYVWWVLTAYLFLRLLNSENPRWWLAIGATVGIGMMTKYTMAFLVAGIIGGVLLTPTRRQLTTPWPWAGAAVALLLFLPNLLWQAQHNFISLEFLASIHDRDVRIGRTQGYLVEQLIVSASPLTIPLWIAGLWFYFFASDGRRYRLIGWLFVIPSVLLLLAQGRSYYLAPAYPMLLAAGAVVLERWSQSLAATTRRLVRGGVWVAVAVGAAVGAALMLPLAPINSGIWTVSNAVHDNFAEQIGWPDLVASVAEIYAGLPAEDRAGTRILTANYGEAAAINLLGADHGLPPAISGVNSYWFRGYGDPAPTSVIVLGYRSDDAQRGFEYCREAGRVTNRYGVRNEETRDHPTIYWCERPRQPWPELWTELRHFG
jgi:Dolichyl-phosphate-mannose-protein mannosyltransferase